ncbi:hypothetical protein SEA_SKOG_157 [Gordonia phage Skog]|uniref:Uncharacterized protein n=1 Tax=Gordonia phage Skog TaxID=2704033 RepID=A0A6G6XJL9_9CAUD|nr:LysM-like endolysin [Gordonia phage Skog]QIG58309.1 hypothetical protein SEA_SKOG_157 [Gordonia phage Skog]
MSRHLQRTVENNAPRLATIGQSGGAARRLKRRIVREGWNVDQDWKPRQGFLYTVVRAISARINQNFDGWPSDELRKAAHTFVGKPVFVNHVNEDPTAARGVIVASRYVEAGNDKYIECIQEVDAERYPKVAHEIVSGGLDSVSMGAEAGFTICSYCNNKAVDDRDLCDHVRMHKGSTLPRKNTKTGKVEDVLVYESCHKIAFFELSYVFDPADETAVASKVLMAAAKKYAECPPGMDCSNQFTESDNPVPGMPELGAGTDSSAPSSDITNVADAAAGAVDSATDSLGDALGGATDAPRSGEAPATNPADSDAPIMASRRRTATIPGFMPAEGARPIDPTKPVFVHTNRHAVNAIKKGQDRQDVWSIKQDDPETGVHVRGYAPEVHMENNKFVVQQAGAQKFKDTAGEDGQGGKRVVHAGVVGFLSSPPSEAQNYSLTDYHPGFHQSFVHRDNGEPVADADRVHFTPDAKMYSAKADNWGRDHEPQLLAQPHPSVNAANMHTIGGEPQDRPPVFGQERTARNLYAYGEVEAPQQVDTLREEGSTPEDDTDDFHQYVSPPRELGQPDLSAAGSIDREQDEAEADAAGAPGAPAAPGGGEPQAQQYIELKIPVPPEQAQQQIPMQAYASAAERVAFVENYFGRRVADWRDAITANRSMTPEETVDYMRSRADFVSASALENAHLGSTTDRTPEKGRTTMGRSTLATRGTEASRGRRRHADGPLVDTGDQSRNDQGEQEEAFITETPPAEPVAAPTDDASNITNTENNLVARVQRGREALLRDVTALANFQKGKTAGVDGNADTVVNPTVDDSASEALTGDHFEPLEETPVETQPKDASLKVFKAFDQWLTKASGKDSRYHTEASLKRAAERFTAQNKISAEAMFPTLGMVLREARKNDKLAKKGKPMQKRADEKLELAAPDDRADVEAPVKGDTDPEAQASQFDLHDFGDNASDDKSDPDLSTDNQFWAPGEGKKTSARRKVAGGILAMRCAEAYVEAGIASHEDRYRLASEFENMNAGVVTDRLALATKFAEVRANDRRQYQVASGVNRGTAKSPLPPGMGGARVAATQRVAAHDPRNDSLMFG